MFKRKISSNNDMFGLTHITFGVPHNSGEGNTWLSLKKFFFGMELGGGILERGGNSSSIILIEEGESQDEITKKIKYKQDKLDLFLRVVCNASLARPFQKKIYFYNTREDIFLHYYNFEDYFKNIDENLFTKYLESPTTALELNFLDALLTWTGDISKFAEIVEYYESVQSNRKYHCLRNCFSHTMAFQKDIDDVNSTFSNLFEFVGNSLDRKSQKNRRTLEILVENILLDLKDIFSDTHNLKK